METFSIDVRAADFDPNAEIEALTAHNLQIGAVASFVGLVRADTQKVGADETDSIRADSVRGMSLEHYPGMTEKALTAIVDEARQRWELLGVRVIHRIGPLRPGERIVLVAVASSHRGDAFAACEFIMDYLKTRAPFWKKEATAQGHRWVDARETDQSAAQRWNESSKNSTSQ
ncbi:MAG TPA: molybdopterin synthase catalytic subunit MoaE [Rhodocyclaceae bacterium]|nr:molybdopterin synthase catalytic subunit MoaE [Rhodocyclaceae bacterium]